MKDDQTKSDSLWEEEGMEKLEMEEMDTIDELRREVLDDAVKDLGRRAVSTLLDDIAREAPLEMEEPDLSFLLKKVREERERLNLDELEDDEEPEDPCDSDFMKEISS